MATTRASMLNKQQVTTNSYGIARNAKGEIDPMQSKWTPGSWSGTWTGTSEAGDGHHNGGDQLPMSNVLPESFWRDQGFQGKAFLDDAQGDNAVGATGATPELQAWAKANGYEPGNTEGYGGILKNGQIVDGSYFGNQSNDDAMFYATTLALGGVGAYASAAGVGAGAAEGGLSGMDLAADGGKNALWQTGGAGASGGGYWNGTDFTGTAPQAGSSNLGGTAATGAKGMGYADWLNAAVTVYGIANQPKAPNTDGLNQAAADSAQLSRDSFDWFKGEFERTRGQRDEAAARDGKIADAQLEGMNFATSEAKDLAARNKAVFRPVEDRIVRESMNFDTPARRAQAVAEATADVESAAGRAQQSNNRAMMRAGVNLDSPAAAALAQDASLAKAKMIAGSTGAATRNVEQQGWARMNDAAALGKGIVGNQATQQQIATSSGSASVNSGAGGINAAQAGTGIMQAGFNTAQQGLQTAGSLYGQAGQLTAGTRGQDLNFLGNAFNSYKRSSKKVKKGTGNVTDGKEELAEVMATPVDKGWQYDAAKGGPDDGGQVHTGPMAETVRAKMGDDVAPGGEVIDMKAMGGKMLAAIQAVTRDVADLRDQMASRARMGKQPATKEA